MSTSSNRKAGALRQEPSNKRTFTGEELMLIRKMQAEGKGLQAIRDVLKCGGDTLYRECARVGIKLRRGSRGYRPGQTINLGDPVTNYPIGKVPPGHPLYEADQEMVRANLAAGLRPVNVDGKIEWRPLARPLPSAEGGWLGSSLVRE